MDCAMTYLPTFQYTDTDATFALPSGTTEQDVVEILAGNSIIQIGAIFLDLVNLTQNATIRVYVRIDDTNYREIAGATFPWTTSDPDGVLAVSGITTDHDIKVTIQSSVAEGASRDIPYTAAYGEQ